MAIGTINRGDLVLVRSREADLQGLFVVRAVDNANNRVAVFPLGDFPQGQGWNLTPIPFADILAVYSASSTAQ